MPTCEWTLHHTLILPNLNFYCLTSRCSQKPFAGLLGWQNWYCSAHFGLFWGIGHRLVLYVVFHVKGCKYMINNMKIIRHFRTIAISKAIYRIISNNSYTPHLQFTSTFLCPKYFKSMKLYLYLFDPLLIYKQCFLGNGMLKFKPIYLAQSHLLHRYLWYSY